MSSSAKRTEKMEHPPNDGSREKKDADLLAIGEILTSGDITEEEWIRKAMEEKEENTPRDPRTLESLLGPAVTFPPRFDGTGEADPTMAPQTTSEGGLSLDSSFDSLDGSSGVPEASTELFELKKELESLRAFVEEERKVKERMARKKERDARKRKKKKAQKRRLSRQYSDSEEEQYENAQLQEENPNEWEMQQLPTYAFSRKIYFVLIFPSSIEQ